MNGAPERPSIRATDQWRRANPKTSPVAQNARRKIIERGPKTPRNDSRLFPAFMRRAIADQGRHVPA